MKYRLGKEKVFNVLKIWVPLTVVITMLTGLMYLLVQQDIRLSTNNPQVQLAEDIAGQLKNNDISTDFMALSTVEISRSLAPFVVVFSESGQALMSSGLLDGRVPSIPKGILDYAKNNNEDRVTWQPEIGVRQALVAVHYSGKNSGFVVAGRSLRESEKLTDSLTLITFVGWIAMVITGLILVAAFQFIF
jgi:hypothetical protein